MRCDVATADELGSRLRWIDTSERADHALLSESDRCAYLSAYAAGRPRDRLPSNNLIHSFKCRPSVARDDARWARRKRQAVLRLASCLRCAVTRDWVERRTWVPVPPSKQWGDPDFDDRLSDMLSLAFAGYDLDLRRLLRQSRSMESDHAAGDRLSESTLYDLLQIDRALLDRQPLREQIVVFDDVLTSGKHFKCCERRLREQRPQASIIGMFLVRRVPERARRSLGYPG